MTVRPIRLWGDPVLRQTATEVVDFGPSLRHLVRDLEETLADAGGAGLAAPQIGIGLRVFTYVRDQELRHLVNPQLVNASVDDEVVDAEGCLSIPGLTFDLARPRTVVARGFDQHGEPVEIVGTERLARCFAHETDHLDGVLFIDRLPPDERKVAMREIRELLLAGDDVRVGHSPHGPRPGGRFVG